MSHTSDTNSKDEQPLQIRQFVDQSAGLKSRVLKDVIFQIFQSADGKTMSFEIQELDEVIPRADVDGQPFLQVNFRSGKKILLTDNLVGFKPISTSTLDMDKLPKVVTTPDLMSVVEAIEEALGSSEPGKEDLEVLRRVFDSVMRGAEAVGFDITPEKLWIQGLGKWNKASA